MATIKPIRAMRYTEKAGALSTCVCPPYDIVSDGEYNALCAENPHNLIRLELPKGGEERYRNAGDLLNQCIGSSFSLNKTIHKNLSKDEIITHIDLEYSESIKVYVNCKHEKRIYEINKNKSS